MLHSLSIRKQFSLASLFVVLTLVAMVAAAYGMRRRAAIAEDHALAKIASKGGWILLYTEGAYVEFYTQPPPRGQLIIDCGTGLKRTYGPTGSSLQFLDADLQLFDDVLKIRSVRLRGTGVSADAVAAFRLKYPKCQVEY